MAYLASPSFDDTSDFDNASRGLIGSLEPCIIKNSSGRVVWDNDKYSFLDGTRCPDSVNPKLWRQAQLLAKQGLFKITDGIYQVRGFDVSNMTLVEGDKGVIVIDPLLSVECIEIAEEMELPLALQKAWHAQGFYGSVNFNVKAIYERYMGWFDGNPAHLWEHPPTQAAQRYVSCMGGIDEVVRKAEEYARDGDLRFAATLLNHAVFADPKHSGAQDKQASVFQQLGYGAENGPWRNFYLTGAMELRTGPRKILFDYENVGMMSALSVEQLLDSIAIRINGIRAQNDSFTIDLHLTDLKERYWVTLSNGALIHRRVLSSNDPVETEDASFGCEIAHSQLLQLLGKQQIPEDVKQWGEPAVLDKIFSYLEAPVTTFNIVLP